MLTKSAAVVLRAVKYGDNSAVLTVFTKDYGLKSLIGGGLHSKKGVLKPSMVQVLSRLQIVFFEKSKGSLLRLKEASVEHHYSTLYYNPVKSSVVMFLAEVLQHVLHEEGPDPDLFDFLCASCDRLDESPDPGMSTFHLQFLYRLTGFLGFSPQDHEKDLPYFDLLNGNFSSVLPPHFHYLEKQKLEAWKALASAVRHHKELKLAKQYRDQLLNALLEYYRLHIKDFGELRTLPVLTELLHS